MDVAEGGAVGRMIGDVLRELVLRGRSAPILGAHHDALAGRVALHVMNAENQSLANAAKYCPIFSVSNFVLASLNSTHSASFVIKRKVSRSLGQGRCAMLHCRGRGGSAQVRVAGRSSRGHAPLAPGDGSF